MALILKPTFKENSNIVTFKKVNDIDECKNVIPLTNDVFYVIFESNAHWENLNQKSIPFITASCIYSFKMLKKVLFTVCIEYIIDQPIKSIQQLITNEFTGKYVFKKNLGNHTENIIDDMGDYDKQKFTQILLDFIKSPSTKEFIDKLKDDYMKETKKKYGIDEIIKLPQRYYSIADNKYYDINQ